MKKRIIAIIAAALLGGLSGCEGSKPQFKEGELVLNEISEVSSADIDAQITRYNEFSASEMVSVLSEFEENMGMNFTEFIGKIPAEYSLTEFYSLSLRDVDVYTFHDYVFTFDSESGKQINLSVSPFGIPAFDTIVKSDIPVHCSLNGATVTGYKLNGSFYALMHHGELDYIIEANGISEEEFEALILSLTESKVGTDVILSNRAGDSVNILSPADSEFFTELISDDSRYVQTMPNCLMDCFMNVGGIDMEYHSDCGNLVRWDNGKCLTLTEEEKTQLNEVFAKYMTLGFARENDSVSINEPVTEDIPAPEDEPLSVLVGPTSRNSNEPNAYVKPVSETHANTIFALLSDKSRFAEGTSDCLNDCVVSVSGTIYYYHSDCGTFNDNANNRSFKLTDSERADINGIISEYIELGSDSISSEPTPVQPAPVQPEPSEPTPVQPVAHINWGISFDVENVSPTGLTLVCTQEKGVVLGDFTTGQAYVLEVKGMYDWEEVEPIIDEIYWNEIAYLINVNGVTKWEIDWSKLYGELPVGEYRIYKEVCGHINMVDTGIRKFYGFFEIGEPPVPVVDDEWGIKFEASEATPTGIKLGIMQYGGEHPEYRYLLDNSFWIEKYVDGKWEFVPYIIDEVAWPVESLNQINNSSFSFTVNWNYYYGELPVGKYRYCRNVVVYGVIESGSNETVTLEKPYYAEFEIVDSCGVTLTVKNVTSESLTIICEQNGSVEAELLSGSFYAIQKFVEDSWVDVEYLPHEYDIVWTAEGWMIPENSKVEWQVNWAWLYGQLSPGKYRIGKNIMYFRGTGDYDQKMYYAEFEIN